MGKTPKPLTIVVFPPLDEWPEIVKLQEQGHKIIKPSERCNEYDAHEFVYSLPEADIIIGPRCWYLDNIHRKHLTLAIKQARLRRYGEPSKKIKGRGSDDSDAESPGDAPDPPATDD